MCGNRENILFADDTCLVYSDNDLAVLIEHVNDRLSIILDWCRYNKLAINPAKSEYMLVTTRPVLMEPRILIGSDVVSRKSSVKYLGLFIDDSLKFHSHVDQLKMKLSRFSGVVYRLRNFFNYRASKNFYYACVYSALTYCISVWGGALTSYRGAMLMKVHERIVRNLFNKFNPGECPFKANKLLKLADIHKLYVSIHMYKYIKHGESETVGDTLDLQTAYHSYNTRGRNLFRTPFPRVEAIRTSYKFQFLNVWNSIPDSVTVAESIRAFKRKLTDYLIENY